MRDVIPQHPRVSPGLGGLRRRRGVRLPAELPLDGGQPLLTLPQLGLGEAVGVLWAQGPTELPEGHQVPPRLGRAALRREALL